MNASKTKPKYPKSVAIKFEKLPWVFLNSKIYRIDKKKLFYILFKLELLLEFIDLADRKASLKITKWLRKEGLLEEEILNVIKVQDFNYKIVRKISKIHFFSLKIK